MHHGSRGQSDEKSAWVEKSGVNVWDEDGPWPLKFDRAAWSFLKFDRRH